MNDNPRFPHDPTGANPSDANSQDHADDQELGAALGDAIGRRVENPVSTPPTSVIAQRAAAQARARATRRTVVGIAASLALVAGGIVAWQNYDGNQSPGEVMVTAPTPAEDPSTPPEPSAVSPAAPGSSGSDKKDSLSQASDSTGAQTSYTNSTPEELSNGPVLQWTEINRPSALGHNIVNAYDGIQSVGDGRILARTWDENGHALFFVTTDGAAWTAVPTPPGISPEHLDVSGPRWLVTGWPTDSFDDFSRVFFSDNQGASWTELTTDHLTGAAGSSGTAQLLPDSADITTVLTSGRNMVIVLQTFVFDEQAVEEIDGEAPRPPVWILASDGGRLELVASYTGWVSTGFSTDSGFTLYLTEGMAQSTLTSSTGRQWSKAASKGSWITNIVRGLGGGIWTTRPAGNGTDILRLDQAANPVTVATFDNLQLNEELTAGPSGLAATVFISNTFVEVDTSAAGLPSGRLTKNGYELRYNKPEGGITLWDVTTDAAVYVFGAEIIQGETLPEGVRAPYQDAEIPPDMDVEVLVFLDPETGDDLVAFTAQDILSLTMTAMGDGGGYPHDLPEKWVGWSANGGQWGWETVETAFGITDDSDSWIELAVGNDFVLARVTSFTSVVYPPDTSAAGQPPAEETTLATVTPEQPTPLFGDNTTASDGDYAIESTLSAQPARWFIARVP